MICKYHEGMKKIILAIVCVSSFSSFAAVKINRTPASQTPSSTELDKSINKIMDHAMEMIGNGSIGAFNHNEKAESINFKKLDQEALKNFPVGSCGKPELVKGRLNAIKSLTTNANDDETAQMIRKLWSNKALIAVSGAEWNQKDGDGVACSIYQYYFYFTHGKGLYISYELTD